MKEKKSNRMTLRDKGCKILFYIIKLYVMLLHVFGIIFVSI